MMRAARKGDLAVTQRNETRWRAMEARLRGCWSMLELRRDRYGHSLPVAGYGGGAGVRALVYLPPHKRKRSSTWVWAGHGRPHLELRQCPIQQRLPGESLTQHCPVPAEVVAEIPGCHTTAPPVH